MHTIQEEETIGDVANEIPRINAALENRHDDHQTYMVEIQGMIQNKPVSVLIDISASLIYMSPIIATNKIYILKSFKIIGCFS